MSPYRPATGFPGLLFIAVLAGCASSDVGRYSAADADQLLSEVVVSPGADADSPSTIDAPVISVRASYGAFTKGMLGGGSNLGSTVALHGTQGPDGYVEHSVRVSMQYSNIGGVFRNYDRAGIEGMAELRVVPLDRDRRYSPGGSIMTEWVAVTVSDSDLRVRPGDDLILRLSDEGGNIESLSIPASYRAAYIAAIDRLATAGVAP